MQKAKSPPVKRGRGEMRDIKVYHNLHQTTSSFRAPM